MSDSRHQKWFSPDEVQAIMAGRASGLTNRQIAYKLGRTYSSVKGFVGRNGLGRERIEWPIGR